MDKKFNTLRTIYLAIATIVILLFISEEGIKKIENFDDFQNPLIYLYVISFIALSEIGYRLYLNGKTKDPNEKFTSGHLQTSSLIRWSIIEGGIFIGIFYLPGYIFSSLILIIYLLLLIPRRDKFIMFLNKKNDAQQGI